MKSFSILRTHTGLSTNVKIIVDSQYNLYLESIDSAPELAATRFKKVQFNKNNFLDELVPYFFKDFPVDIAFSVKYDKDNDNMSTDFSTQYDDVYLAGARNILDNKNYQEEFEYFAPLYVFKHSLPKYFIIFRVDGPGLNTLTRNNFRSEFLNNLKTVKVFDLTKNTVLGEWFDNNFTNNVSFPIAPLEVDFRDLEFTKWIGMDYDSGGWTYKPLYLGENLENENTLFDFERFFLDGYRVNRVVFPHILNMSYLFDDTPATPDSLRKWSINRYAGFYLEDLELIDAVTPYSMAELWDDVVIYSGNVLASPINGDPFKDRFRDDIDMWVEYEGNFFLVKKFEETSDLSVVAQNIGGKAKKVVVDTVKNPVLTKYRIISDLNLSGSTGATAGYPILNQRGCYINPQNQIVKLNGSAYIINDIGFADVNIIEINGIYHNIQYQNGYLTLVTDYGFKFSEKNSFTYYTNAGVDGFSFTWDLLITKNNLPKSFKIYRLKFADVKDFDTQVVDSEMSRFEYEKRNDLTKTEETKMHLTDLRSKSSPQDFDDFTFKGKTELVPVSSDYTANLETFRIENNKLTDLWRKNPVYCRWGYQNSLSAHDYPYLLNNNDIHEDYNRTVDTKNLMPYRPSRNLDYFYTINSGTTSYLHHSLHVEKNIGNAQDSSYQFELDKYLEVGSASFLGQPYTYTFSYFDLFFSQTQSFIDGELIHNKKKYSYFEGGDRVEPNTTVFRGLKFRLFEVDSIKNNPTSIENINLFSSNLFQDYKFSILLSSNDWMVSDESTLYKPYYWNYFIDNQLSYSGNVGFLTSYGMSPSNVSVGDIVEIDQFYPYITPEYQATASVVTNVGIFTYVGYGFTIDKPFVGITPKQPGIWRNKMQWQVIRNWEHDKSYNVGDYVMYEGVSFRVIDGVTISNPLDNPINLVGSYSVATNFNQFWNYTATASWVYIYDEYYQFNNSGSTVSFWNPSTSTYSIGNTVIYDNRFFSAVTFSSSYVPVGVHPVTQDRKIQSSSEDKYWREVVVDDSTSQNFKWKKIELWDKNSGYSTSKYVVYNETLYLSNSSVTYEDIPGVSTNWGRIYSFVPDTSFIYGTMSNSIVKIGDTYYYCQYNPNITLDNGITIYINKRWKNVLVNIAINDNTISSDALIMDETRNIERDHLYVETNGRLTAANFIRQINDLDTIYGFADYTSYVVIEEDGTFKKYKFGNNLESLPYYIVCEEPDELNLKNDSLRYALKTLDKNTLKPYRSLVNGEIDNLEKIDFYNEVPLGVEITNVKSDPQVLPNYNNQKTEIFQHIFRHTGYYMPIFYEVQLFKPYHLVTDTSVCSVTFEFSQEEVFWIVSLVATTENLLFNIDSTNNYNQLNPTSGWWQFDSIFTDITNLINSNSNFNSTFSSDTVTIFGGSCGEQFELRLWDGSGATGPNFNVSPNPEDYPDNFLIKKGIFRPYLQKPVEENMIFDDGLSLFGVMKQRVVSKINRKENILKLRNDTTYDSIYPMLDEYGYMIADYFIFKSTWDFEYHLEVNKPNISSVPTLQNIYQTLYIQSIVKKYNSI